MELCRLQDQSENDWSSTICPRKGVGFCNALEVLPQKYSTSVAGPNLDFGRNTSRRAHLRQVLLVVGGEAVLAAAVARHPRRVLLKNTTMQTELSRSSDSLRLPTGTNSDVVASAN